VTMDQPTGETHPSAAPDAGRGDSSHERNPSQPPEEPATKPDREPPTRPVVVVPGILGSDLYFWFPGQPDERIWPPVDAQGKVEDPLRLIQSGDNIRPRAGALFRGIYDGLIMALEAMGYVEGQTLFFFPYNWVQACDKNGRLLARYIRQVAEKFPGRKVDVVNHSMGGIVTRSAIQLHGALGWVDRSVYIASPHFGASKAYFALHPDFPVELVDGGWIDFTTYVWFAAFKGEPLKTKLKILAENMESVYDLLPDRYYFQRHHLVDMISGGVTSAVSPEGVNYWTDRRVDFELPQMQIQAQRAMAFKASLAKTPPERNLIIYSNSLATTDMVLYDDDYAYSITLIIPSPPHTVTLSLRSPRFRNPFASPQMGDETVPSWSGSAGGAATAMVPGSHVALPNLPAVHALIAAFLSGP